MHKVTNRIPSGTIPAIPAKAHAHRALIAAALGDGPSTLDLTWFSKDILATMASLEALGARIDKTPQGVTVYPLVPSSGEGAIVPGESGTTLRLLIPVSMTVRETVKVTAEGRLPDRPLGPLTDAMKEKGVSFSADKPPFTMTGHLESGDYSLVGNVSSQFFSGLLMAAPQMGGITLSSIGKLESRDYVLLTNSVMQDFGVPVTEVAENTFTVPANCHFHSQKNYGIEGDWSNGAIWLVASAMTGQAIPVKGLKRNSIQADRRILSILEEAGAAVMWDEVIDAGPAIASVSCTKKATKPLHVDLGQMPDLLPVLSALACSIEGTSRFVNGARLRLKESDRLEAVKDLVTALGGEATITGDDLTVVGTGKLKGGRAFCVNDHRLVMAAALMALISTEEVVIEDSQAISKSYPDFFDDWNKLGGESHEL